jgi:hypothetical protein
MQDPNVLLDAIVAALQSNSELVAALGSADKILTYRHQDPGGTNLEQSLIDQPPSTLLVAWKGTRTGNFARMEAVKHDFLIGVKPSENVTAGAIWQLLREGVCAATGMKFKLSTLHEAVNPPEAMQCAANTRFIAPNYGLFDFTEITFTLTERGIDN